MAVAVIPTGSPSPIVFDNLVKKYGDFTAVSGLSLEIERNSFTGLLGPNGAGKSTSLKILTNLVHATSGHVYLNGSDVAADPKRALEGVGCVVETPEFYSYLTPRQTFEYIGDILGLTRENCREQTQAILEKVKMTEWADHKISTFSKGMRQRIAIGQALIDDPQIVILDEPTSGLDPRGMAEMREILRNLRNGGNLTVLMSSHMMYEVSDLCDRIAIINHGTLILNQTYEQILDTGIRHLVVTPLDYPDEEMVGAISQLDHVEKAYVEGTGIGVTFRGEKSEMAGFYRDLAHLDFPIIGMSESSNALEERYLSIVKESRR